MVKETSIENYGGYDIFFDGVSKFYFTDKKVGDVYRTTLSALRKVIDQKIIGLPVLVATRRNTGYWRVERKVAQRVKGKWSIEMEDGSKMDAYEHAIFLPNQDAEKELREISEQVYGLYQRWSAITEELHEVTVSNFSRLRNEYNEQKRREI